MTASETQHQKHAAAQAIPAKGFLILLLGALTAVGPLSIDMYLPAFPELSRAFGVSISSVELSLSAFFIGLAIGQLFFGPLADFFGRKRPLQIGIAIYAVSSLACVFAPGIESLIVLRFLQAIGGCSGMVISRAIVRDLFDHRDAAKIYSLLMLIMGVAPILAPTFGAYISAAFGWKGIFALLFVLSSIALIAVSAFLPETRPRTADSKLSLVESLKSYINLLGDSSFMRFAIPNSLISASMFAYVAGSPFVFIELFHMKPTSYGWVFGLNAVGIIGASQLNRLLLRWFGPEQIVSRALIVTAISAASLLAACVWYPSGLITLMVPLFIMIASVGFVGPNTAALAMAKQGHRAGTASALYGSLQFSVAFVSSFLVSSFHAESALPMATVIAGCVLFALVTFYLFRTKTLAVSVALIAALVSFAPMHAVAQEKEFNYEDLKALVEKHDFRSVEQVIPHLPNELKKNFTLMHKSRSIQRSNEAAPRALLFSQTAKLVLGFNGDANDAGFDRLEVMQFEEKTDRFKFAFIYFADLDTKAEVIDSPMNCIGCHGRQPQDLHPIWDVDLVWRGAYGSQDDTFANVHLDPELKLEAENYAKFLTTTSSHERYRHLDFSKPLDSAPKNEIESRPNLRLGILLTRLQVKRAARQMEQAPGYAAIKNQILSQLMGCSAAPVDQVFRADVEARLKAFLLPIYGEVATDNFLRTQLSSTVDAFAIGKSLGLDVGEWPLTGEKRTYAIFDGSFTFKELLAAELFDRISRENPALRAHYKLEGLASSALGLAPTSGALAADSLGGRLANSALQACKNFSTPSDIAP